VKSSALPASSKSWIPCSANSVSANEERLRAIR
jgi:hypothetical protein